MVVDSVVAVSPTPPTLLQAEPTPLLFHSRDDATAPVVDTPEARLVGWKRIVLFALFFRPSGLRVVEGADTVFGSAFRSPARDFGGWLGLYPFEWQPGWERSFEAIRGGLFVAPGLQSIIFNRFPSQVLDWADTVAAWEFDKVIPAHLDAPVPADGRAWRKAFSFLEEKGPFPELGRMLGGSSGIEFLAEDMVLLDEAEEGLVADGTILPRAPLASRRSQK
jgi:hypothetical protein